MAARQEASGRETARSGRGDSGARVPYGRIFISPEAPERWIQRVQPELVPTEAFSAVKRFLDRGRVTANCPPWLGGTVQPNTRYLLNPDWPGVVGILAGRTLKTVIAHRPPGASGPVGPTVRWIGDPQIGRAA